MITSKILLYMQLFVNNLQCGFVTIYEPFCYSEALPVLFSKSDFVMTQKGSKFHVFRQIWKEIYLSASTLMVIPTSIFQLLPIAIKFQMKYLFHVTGFQLISDCQCFTKSGIFPKYLTSVFILFFPVGRLGRGGGLRSITKTVDCCWTISFEN